MNKLYSFGRFVGHLYGNQFYFLALLFFSFPFLTNIGYSADENINTPVNFPDLFFRKVVEEFMGVSTNGDFTAEQAAAKTGKLNCANRGIHNLLGIAFFTGITELDCSSDLNLTENQRNLLISLDLSLNTKLQILRCNGNQLSSLDLGKFTALIELYCSNNQLTQLIILNSVKIKRLECSTNKISSLDLSLYTALEYLDCSKNPLSSLSLDKNNFLKTLYCEDDQLTQLNLLPNTALTFLSCRGNRLTTLDTARNLILRTCDCSNNQITSLSLTNNLLLELLYCSGNQLNTLNITRNTGLKNLDCSLNALSLLDVSKNTNLIGLSCTFNRISNIAGWVSNNGLGTTDIVDIRYNDLDCGDWEIVKTLRNRMGTPVFIGSLLTTGFAYSPQNGINPFDCQNVPTPTFTPIPTNTPTPTFTPTRTPIPIPTFTPTNTPINVVPPTFTSTPVPNVPTFTPTATSTSIPTPPLTQPLTITRSFSPNRYIAGQPVKVILTIQTLSGVNLDVLTLEEKMPENLIPININESGNYIPDKHIIRWFILQTKNLEYTVTPSNNSDQDYQFQGEGNYLIGTAQGAVQIVNESILSKLRCLHPVDIDANQNISTQELLAAAARWKNGELSPTTSELLNAAGIWKQGGAYLCDVNGNFISSAPVGKSVHPRYYSLSPDESIITIRDLPESFILGTAAIITIQLVPNEGLDVLTIEEKVPRGWLVTDISQGGNFIPASGVIRWFILSDFNVPLTYTIIPIGSTQGEFSGTVSWAAGSSQGSQEIGGETIVTTQVRRWFQF